MSIEIADFIQKHKVITICRRLYGQDLLNLVRALHQGGMNMVEVTFDQSDPDCINKTAEAIRMLVENFGSSMKIGAGTVLTKEQVRATKDAGGSYIISPNVDVEIIKYTKELGLVSIPGAMTPSEILTAHNNGADFVKLFPAGNLGFDYIKNIMAPISHVKLIATGGVTEEILPEYLKLGFAGAGIGGRLTDRKLITTGEFETFTERAKGFSKVVMEY
ncbi:MULTISPECIES: bifunctional 4-hydroxy-2-oxoglutarate aldolase/2-dehydro-3-deoxy-phosphogluconate aldolase [Pelosinus]|uniref:KDPG and KHG aldolase n=1 Tax=Pelosinus fermentans B4 TaxID=1149862 RepID=I8RKG5_9FIRM|nr:MULTISPECIES: bifunctional 4-hydroxy-2-oxoglutarate aldolase/2-dehydro-3-deoxy-phosphogluconate aldolase [Pelosinus]EIW18865.1 KDPG and KHG aldolase [Pelosinus fermentans B4]EIW21925.1 KDPG and KHG aldolase [Pelosinus fermentans A11]OAM95224.1 KDPG and KHG aldolase [Pelosinus fermentans DSM 17108]SDR25009.1 2-dehydro-3-deoxyphosphogluconate aldolase / (4S)-4-hydroxy-2-oxoglutarate aldolase [Pelosinus fermentans]